MRGYRYNAKQSMLRRGVARRLTACQLNEWTRGR
jgi:hypothetical protein